MTWTSNPRSAVTSNGTDIWVTGAANGVRYTTLGGTTSAQLSTTVVNLRGIAIADGQLYVSTASGTAVRIGTVGSGLPTTSGQTITNLPGFPTTNGPYEFTLFDLNAAVPGVDTLYVADDGTNMVAKFSLVSGTWTSNGSVALTAPRGIAGFANGASVSLFVTNATTLSSFTDTSGYNGTLSATLTPPGDCANQHGLSRPGPCPSTRTRRDCLSDGRNRSARIDSPQPSVDRQRIIGRTTPDWRNPFGVSFCLRTRSALTFTLQGVRVYLLRLVAAHSPVESLSIHP
jgi:hypothetical protein